MIRTGDRPWTRSTVTRLHVPSFLRLRYLSALLVIFSLASLAQTTKPEWRATTALPAGISGHRSVTLHTGDVLVCGGLDAGGVATSTSLLYRDGRWTSTENQMTNARAYHSLVAVRGIGGISTVFAIGGVSGGSGSYSSLASVEVLQFNSALKTWSWRMIGNLPVAVSHCAAAYDKKQYIIISGGRIQTSAALGSGTPTAISARIDAQSLRIERIGDMATARSEHATLMLNGARNDSTVLSANGEVNNVPTTEILNGIVWDARANPPAFQQRNASNFSDMAEVARMVGGADATGAATNRGQWYDTKSGWRAMPRMQTARSNAFIAQVAGIRDTSSNYLIVGGESGANATAGCEIFSLPGNGNPNGAWSPFNDMINAAAERCINIESNNLALASGGRSGNTRTSACELYQPLSANDLSFGQEEIGRESGRTSVTLRNTWLLPVMITNLRIPGSAEFRLNNSRDSIVIAPGSSVDVDVRFRPNTIGPRSASLLLNIGGLIDSVRLQGEGIKSTISVLSNSIDCGSRLLRTDTTVCFPAIRNDGKDTTVIDSLIITPAGSFFIVSPTGRVRVAPDSTLTVCVRFTPNARQSFSAAAEVHISDRVYPVSLNGIGIRRIVRTTTQIACDTVSVAPGDSLVYQLILSNDGDLPVRVDSTIITTSLNGTFGIASPSPFPLQLAPKATRIVSIVFRPQREAQEQGTVQFINDGDTLCIAQLCFVPRNRSININTPGSTTLTVCEGDSVSLPLVLENPGNFDALDLDSVYIENVPGRVIGFSRTTLGPRQSIDIDLTLAPNLSGAQTASIVVRSNQGLSRSAIRLNVLPAMKCIIDPTAASIGSQVVLTVRRTDALSSPMNTKLRMHYNGSVIAPRSIRNAPGRTYINEQMSSCTAAFGVCTVNIQWNSHPGVPDMVAGIVCDVLRGDDTQTDVRLDADSASSVCVTSNSATVLINNQCGGRTALISTKSVVMMTAFPSPAHDEMRVQLQSLSELDGSLRIVNLQGDVLSESDAQFSQQLDCHLLPSGVYMLQFVRNNVPLISQPITILR